MPDEPVVEVASPAPTPVVTPEEPKVTLGVLKEFLDDFLKERSMPPEPTPAPAAAPVETPAPVAAPVAAPEVPQTVTIPLSQFQDFLASKTQLAQEQQRKDQETRERVQKEAEANLERGQLQEGIQALRTQKEKELAEVNAKLAETELATRQYVKTGELSRALADQPLVPGALPQLMTLFGSQLNVVPENGSYAVRTPTMQTADAFVKEMLGKPEFAHFVRPGSTGGTAGSTGGHHTAPTAPAQATTEQPPVNMGVAAIMDTLSAMKEQQGFNAGIPANLNPRAAFGLKAVKS